MGHFLGYDNVVRYVLPCYKALFLQDNVRKHTSKSISNYFHNQFIQYRTQADGSELTKVFRMIDLRDENNQSIVKLFNNSIPKKTPRTKSQTALPTTSHWLWKKWAWNPLLLGAFKGSMSKRAFLISSSVTTLLRKSISWSLKRGKILVDNLLIGSVLSQYSFSKKRTASAWLIS